MGADILSLKRGKHPVYHHLSMMLAVTFSQMPFDNQQVKGIPSYSQFLKLFYFFIFFLSFFKNQSCWILSNVFSVSVEMIKRFLSFILLIVFIITTLTDFQVLNQSYILEINLTCRVIFTYCWILFASILLRTFTSMFTSNSELKFSFLVMSLSSFCYLDNSRQSDFRPSLFFCPNFL